MDQTEQIIEALKDAGVKAEQLAVDAMPVLVAQIRARAIVTAIVWGCVVAAYLVFVCYAYRRLPDTIAASDGNGTEATTAIVRLTLWGIVCVVGAFLCVGGVIEATSALRVLVAPHLRLVTMLR